MVFFRKRIIKVTSGRNQRVLTWKNKRKFYERLDVKIENKESNNSFLNREKYELLIQEISQLKRGDHKKEPKDYQLLKR